VLKSERFVAMEVFASATPFATHIFPLRHPEPVFSARLSSGQRNPVVGQ
jgi:hypothetical protein